jgi:hypothetical protein
MSNQQTTMKLGDDEIVVGRMPTGSVILSKIFEARFPKPGRHIEQHLRGYGRDESGAVIDLLRLRAQRDMIKILDQG